MQLELFPIKSGDRVSDGRRIGTVRVATRTWLYFECAKQFCGCHGRVTDRSHAYHRVGTPTA